MLKTLLQPIKDLTFNKTAEILGVKKGVLRDFKNNNPEKFREGEHWFYDYSDNTTVRKKFKKRKNRPPTIYNRPMVQIILTPRGFGSLIFNLKNNNKI